MSQDTSQPDDAGQPSHQNPAMPGHVDNRQLSPSEFGTIMVHFYRGEISRANVWRQRLDATFNWAVLTTGTTLSFAFGNVSSPHVVILINSLLIAVFLFIEARRYRYYELWSSRVRVIETDFLAPIMSPKSKVFGTSNSWADHLATDLLRPHFTVGVWEAVGRRLRRNYIWVFVLLALSWNIKIAIHPVPVSSWNQFLERASVGALSGSLVIMIGFIYNGLILAIAFFTISRSDWTEVSTQGMERIPPATTVANRLRRRRKDPDPDMTATFQPIRHTGTLRKKDS